MSAVFMAVLLMTVSGTLLYLLLLLLRPLTRKTFGAAWHYRACALAVLFLLIPAGLAGGRVLSVVLNNAGGGVPQISGTLSAILPTPRESAPTGSAATGTQTASPARPTASNGRTVQNTAAVQTEAPQTAAAAAQSPRELLSYLPYAWFLGAIGFAAFQILRHARFKSRLARTNLPVEDGEKLALLARCLSDMAIKRKITLMSSSIVKTPMLTGLFKCVLILPEIHMNDEELRMVFHHELTHLKRLDIFLKLLALLAGAVHWFNPASYRLRRELDYFCELSCDERVVSGLNAEEGRFYGETILNVLCRVARRREGLFAGFAATRRGFENRLTGILNYKAASKRASAFSTALLFLLGLAGCAGAGIASAKPVKTKELTVCVDAGVYQSLQHVIVGFAKENKDIKITYDLIPDAAPDNQDEREAKLTQLSADLKAGKGPDLFILDTNYLTNELPLFDDTEKAMREGVFSDALPLLREAGVSMDDFIAPVIEAGRLEGKQYIVPIDYQVVGILTNDATRTTMGEAVFDSAAATMAGIRAVTEIPGVGSKSATGFLAGTNLIAYFCNPYWLTKTPLVDYSGRTAQVDTALARDILTTGKISDEKVGNTAVLLNQQKTMTLDAWKNYVQSDQYFEMCGNLRVMAHEAGISELAGVTPHVDPLPSENGGVSAIISLYAGINANSPNKVNAATMIKLLLSAQYQANPDNGASWASGWPVRKGVLAEHLLTYVNQGKYSLGQYNFGAYTVPLSEKSVNAFLAIESKVTSAVFPPPVEITVIMAHYFSGQTDLDTAMAQMQAYWDESLAQ